MESRKKLEEEGERDEGPSILTNNNVKSMQYFIGRQLLRDVVFKGALEAMGPGCQPVVVEYMCACLQCLHL